MPHAAYFISDAHLGAEPAQPSERENRLIDFLEHISSNIGYLFIVGDLFDFWIEYNYAIRTDYFHILYEFRRLKKQGVELHYLAGNHDFALGTFLSETIGIEVHLSGCLDITLQGKALHICHGDGLLPSDHGYRILKKLLRNPLCQRIYKFLHPDWGIPLAEVFSRTSRSQANFRTQERECEIYRQIAWNRLQGDSDIVIFGHTHYPEIRSWNHKLYCNTGDWIQHFTYAVLENAELRLHRFGREEVPFDVLQFSPD